VTATADLKLAQFGGFEPAVKALIAQGMSDQAVVDWLSPRGVSISTTTLQRYIAKWYREGAAA
jgi:hypothetical protein